MLPSIHVTQSLISLEGSSYRKSTVLEPLSSLSSIATFRSDYEKEIEYEYDFLIPGHRFKIVICPTNVIPIVSFCTGQQQGGTRALRT